jgi:hypothetical protein
MSADVVRDEGSEVLERIIARGLVLGGGIFWALLAVGTTMLGPYQGLPEAVMKYAAIPLVTAAVILGIGWRYERLAGILLFAATAATIAFGAIFAWEMGMWMFMFTVLIGPMFMSGTLFLLASRNETLRLAVARPVE